MPLLAAMLAVFTLASSNARAQFQFVGVAAGDASSTQAVVWTRGVDSAAPAAAAVLVDVANDTGFTVGLTTLSVTTDPAKDYTAKLLLTGLQSGTTYFYRFRNGPATSMTGTFKTAPSATTAAPFHLAFSGDCDGLMRPYALANVFGTLNLDAFVFLGDTIYETASTGSAAAALTGTTPSPTATGATQAQLFADYSRKYREQFLPVNLGGQNGLQGMFAAQGNYTLLDNHELGNRQYINGGAAPGGTVGGMPTGAGVDARQSANDVNTTGQYMNRSLGFQTLQQVFLNYQPIEDRGLVSAPTDPRSDGTQRLYFAQPWGQNATFFNVDDRSYRDIRLKTAANADDSSSPRADNPGRTMLGATQLAWLEQSLLAAQNAGTKWKIVAVSSPIDQLGPIGGGFSVPVAGAVSDGGKSWMGGYRAERNALLTFIAQNHIYNVVFLSTDDHQNRVNELMYSATGQTDVQSTYMPVPHCFTIVAGPLGATGPDTITNHSLANLQAIATNITNAQVSAGMNPLGLAPTYPGLHDVAREGDPLADVNRSAFDFFSPDTFNLATLDVSADGNTLTVGVTGINSTATNSFLEYDAVNNPARQVLSFQVDAFTPCNGALCGQTNSACASLLVNGIGHLAQGPIDVTAAGGSTLSFNWAGAPSQPLALVGTPQFVLAQNLGGAVLADVDLTSYLVLFSGFDPLWGPLFHTNAAGTAVQTFSVPASATGSTLLVQGVVFDSGNTCSGGLGYMTTASFALHF